MAKIAGAAQALSSSPQEVSLIQQAVSGDPDAFAELYETYLDEVYRFIFYRVEDESVAEDLTSQVFLKAWDNIGRYQVRGLPFSAWLFRIARNIVIDYYRTRKDIMPLEEPGALIEPDPAANVAKEVEKRLQGEWLRRMLQQLTEEQKEVLTLKFIHGLSTKEVAKVMKKRQGAIRALQMRGLQALADLIGVDDEQAGTGP